ncbi:Uma2 family endonuclease [Virgibacillus sp. MSJ-26]|uniref:Uma2 family endonuclease n=1 Tax=Virgibacillus sp. MSJ-26 TaxID=2841522 RepID=UPI001C10FED4|nr:Uma2 family endonuclease [Virgibacillus sp. MSJ-26]MBU5468317.1 Uma2 family endonuclease [Virgibacillus sp. MSJ-26]
MSLPSEELVTLQEFYQMREETDQLLEYIDGIVFMSPSPSTMHQRISMRLSAKLFNLLENADCEVFSAPFDVKLSNEEIPGEKVVIPDLSVICDKSRLDAQQYNGVPTLIIEIISPSNQAHDLITKLNLYMQYGVKEYWIVNPLLNTIMIYALNEKAEYEQSDNVREKGIVTSKVLSNFKVDAAQLFQE